MNRRYNKHRGSSFDGFLKEQDIYEEARNASIKTVVAWQLERAMAEQELSKSKMAAQMKTSRSQLDCLLDPKGENVTLETLERAALILGRKVKLELV